MSVSKWAYEPSRCDGRPCCGECDFCFLWQNDGMSLSWPMIAGMMRRAALFVLDLEEDRALARGREQDG